MKGHLVIIQSLRWDRIILGKHQAITPGSCYSSVRIHTGDARHNTSSVQWLSGGIVPSKQHAAGRKSLLVDFHATNFGVFDALHSFEDY